MKNTFKGGVHPHDFKYFTADKPLEKLAAPPTEVIIPLSQHAGAPCDPLVKVGDTVKMGQKIGDNPAPISAPVHSSVSGTVTAIKPWPHVSGRDVNAVIIENDFNDTLDESIKPRASYEDMSPDEICGVIREAGIVGMGGAGFPTATKIKFGLQSKIEYL
jgi:electron transport complex protein RnfC